MAAGDVEAQIVDNVTATIDAAVTGMRLGASDKFLMCSVGNGKQVLIVAIEE